MSFEEWLLEKGYISSLFCDLTSELSGPEADYLYEMWQNDLTTI